MALKGFFGLAVLLSSSDGSAGLKAFFHVVFFHLMSPGVCTNPKLL